MTDFRTQIPPPSFPFRLNHQDQILCVGSCFSDHMGSRLINHKFNALLNPFGILYNPVSIYKNLSYALEGRRYDERDIFEHRGLWHSFQHPGEFSRSESGHLLDHIHQTNLQVQEHLRNTNRLILTFGSSMVYEHLEYEEIVANCHKLPAKAFQRRRLRMEEVIQPLQQLFEKLRAINPELQILLTVSPVRHGKDGMVTNQRSKAVLLLAVDELCDKLEYVHYFPSYELLLDDLRDYRFYKPDMLHPNEVAIQYIWEYLSEALFSDETKQLNKSIGKLRTAAHHRPLQPGTEEHLQFLKKMIQQTETLQKQYPTLSFDKEAGIFAEQRHRYFTQS